MNAIRARPPTTVNTPERVIYGDPLSVRERLTMVMICEGATHKEIAKAHFVSVKTVQKHVFNLYRKWNVHSHVATLRHAILHGHYHLCPLDEAIHSPS